MKQLLISLVVPLVVLGAAVFASLGWRNVFRSQQNSRTGNWRVVCGIVGLVLVSFSVILFLVYGTRNALTAGDGNGNWTTVYFIRTGNYLSLGGVVMSLTGKGSLRWPTFLSGCLLLFMWSSAGMSL
jgi:hypothetical protein